MKKLHFVNFKILFCKQNNVRFSNQNSLMKVVSKNKNRSVVFSKIGYSITGEKVSTKSYNLISQIICRKLIEIYISNILTKAI